MNRDPVTSKTAELLDVLGQLIGQQESLEAAVSEKLSAMRRCDPDAMNTAAAREGEIVARVNGLDRHRLEIVSRLCDLLNIARPADARNLTLRVLAAQTPEPTRTRLIEMGNALRERMLRVAEANRVVEIVCREMMTHFKVLFSAFTTDEDAPRTYSRGGQVEAGPATRVLDAVG